MSQLEGAVSIEIADPFLHRVGALLLEHRDELVDEMVARLTARDAFYAQAMEHLGDEVRVAIAEQVERLLHALAGHAAIDFALTEQIARRRAEQGVPVASLLHSYRLCSEIIWERGVALTRGPLDGVLTPESVVAATKVYFALTERFTDVTREAFEEAIRDHVSCTERARTKLLDRLFDGGRELLPLITDVARTLDMPERSTFVVVSLDAPSEATAPVTELVAAMRSQGLRSAWTPRHERHLGIVVLERRGDRACATKVLSDILLSRSERRIGVSPPFSDLGRTGEHAALADIARACRPVDGGGVTWFDESPVAALVVATPAIAARTARCILGPLLALDDDEQRALFASLRAWRDAGGSTSLAAERLFCHRNTVRNRLQRVEALTGRSLDDPKAVTEICVALSALELLGDI